MQIICGRSICSDYFKFAGQLSNFLSAPLTTLAVSEWPHGKSQRGGERAAMYLVDQTHHWQRCPADQTRIDISTETEMSGQDLIRLHRGNSRQIAQSLAQQERSMCDKNRLS
jgi:hypothetical protein